MTESRHKRQVRIKREKARHQEIIGTLTGDIIKDFEHRLDTTDTPCQISEQVPNPWIDYDSDEERREPYETDAPSRNMAAMLCEGCPLIDMCETYGLATGASHGVYAGRARERGRYL